MAILRDSSLLVLVKEEMESSLNEIELKLELYIDNPEQDDAHLEICKNNLHQIGGVCQMVGMPGAFLLVEEMEELIKALSMKDELGKEEFLIALGQGVTMLHRYMAYVALSQKLMPEILLPTINEIRKSANKGRLPENHFFIFPEPPLELIKKLPEISNEQVESDREQFISHCRRLRHMYQVGLIGVIKDESLMPNLKLMDRAINRLIKLIGKTRISPLWQLGAGVIESFQNGDVEINLNRKMLLGKLEREFKRLTQQSEELLESDPPEELVSECVYIISLAKENDNLQYKNYLGLENKLSDKTIRTHLMCMTGPDGSAVNAIVAALKEDLTLVKEALDLSNRGKLEEQKENMVDKLNQVSKTLKMLELEKISESIFDWTEKLSKLSNDTEDQLVEEVFSNVAELMFKIDNSVSQMLTKKITSDDEVAESEEEQEEKISNTIFDEARIIVVKESRQGISHAKNAITSYMDSGWDASHLVDVPETLNTVGGALLYLRLPRASSIFNGSKNFVQERLLQSDSDKEDPNVQMMETLADALSSIDYYLEGLEDQKPIGDDILLIAEESMDELGYPIAAA